MQLTRAQVVGQQEDPTASPVGGRIVVERRALCAPGYRPQLRHGGIGVGDPARAAGGAVESLIYALQDLSFRGVFRTRGNFAARDSSAESPMRYDLWSSDPPACGVVTTISTTLWANPASFSSPYARLTGAPGKNFV